ncbi:hypothetical protein THAOC_19959, partial [Thalassiosira oceanica]
MAGAWLVSGSVVLRFSGVTAIPEEWSAPRGQVGGLAIPTSGFGVKLFQMDLPMAFCERGKGASTLATYYLIMARTKPVPQKSARGKNIGKVRRPSGRHASTRPIT